MGLLTDLLGDGNATSQTAVTIPPLSLVSTSNAVGWPTANTALFSRFSLERRTTRRYARFNIGTASGNIQVGVIALASNLTFTREVDSGVIASPTAGDVSLDLGEFTLDPGEYATFVWADNTTITIPRVGSGPLSASRHSFILGGQASGVPASGTVSTTGNAIIGLVLDSNA